ncbi:hypothetical protein [Streptomyces sioyaensis]|uniref:hypothetical protein n=1 Tax=Streptomyces sioyaensis TaxID=67364 RepID=UPI0036F03FC6
MPGGVGPEEEQRARAALMEAIAAAPAGVPVTALLAEGERRGQVPPARAAVTPPQVSAPNVAGDAPDQDADDRVPQRAPRSLAAGVRELRAAGIGDAEVMSGRLSALMGHEVPVASVKRETRRQTAAARSAAEQPQQGEGGYV